MASTGLQYATSTTTSSETGSPWANVSNLRFITDGLEGFCTISTKNVSSVRVLDNYGFSSTVPANATISALELEVVWRVTTTGGIGTLGVAVWHSSFGLLSTRKNTAEPTSLSTQTFDIFGDAAWTPSDLSDASLKVQLRMHNGNSATNPGYRVDSVGIVVGYSVPAPLARQFFMVAGNLDGLGSDGLFPGNALD